MPRTGTRLLAPSHMAVTSDGVLCVASEAIIFCWRPSTLSREIDTSREIDISHESRASSTGRAMAGAACTSPLWSYELTGKLVHPGSVSALVPVGPRLVSADDNAGWVAVWDVGYRGKIATPATMSGHMYGHGHAACADDDEWGSATGVGGGGEAVCSAGGEAGGSGPAIDGSVDGSECRERRALLALFALDDYVSSVNALAVLDPATGTADDAADDAAGALDDYSVTQQASSAAQVRDSHVELAESVSSSVWATPRIRLYTGHDVTMSESTQVACWW